MSNKCFEYFKKNNQSCEKSSCRYWIECSNFNNCCIVGAEKNEKITLQNIGELFDVTRMRICQIEKIAIQKLKEKVLDSL